MSEGLTREQGLIPAPLYIRTENTGNPSFCVFTLWFLFNNFVLLVFSCMSISILLKIIPVCVPVRLIRLVMKQGEKL